MMMQDIFQHLRIGATLPNLGAAETIGETLSTKVEGITEGLVKADKVMRALKESSFESGRERSRVAPKEDWLRAHDEEALSQSKETVRCKGG